MRSKRREDTKVSDQWTKPAHAYSSWRLLHEFPYSLARHSRGVYRKPSQRFGAVVTALGRMGLCFREFVTFTILHLILPHPQIARKATPSVSHPLGDP